MDDEPTVKFGGYDGPIWQAEPVWVIECDGSRVGMAIDDGCAVFLADYPDGWRPLRHIPRTALRFAYELLAGSSAEEQGPYKPEDASSTLARPTKIRWWRRFMRIEKAP